MFGRGLRLTALGGLASAAFISTNAKSRNGGPDNFGPNGDVQIHLVDNEHQRRRCAGPEAFSRSPDLPREGDLEIDQEHNKANRTAAQYEIIDIETLRPNEQSRLQAQQEKLKAAINKARDLCWCKMYESGSPGMVVAISVNGKLMWQHGFGYADLENKLLAGTGCVMRIASISKCLTMAVVAKLWEEGKLNLDGKVSDYVDCWPQKLVNGQPVDITVRQLCCHLSGIRHYDRKEAENSNKEKSEFELKEYHIKEHFKTTEDSLKLFKDDELFSTPGSEFLYTTHGYTLLAAVVEKVTGEPFHKYMKKQFKELGLNNTQLDENGPLVQNRSKYYVRNKNHQLRNAPYVDNSYKWAGGGFLSNVQDLVKFGNAMLYSYQDKRSQNTSTPSENVKEQPKKSTNLDKTDNLKNNHSDGKSSSPSSRNPPVAQPAQNIIVENCGDVVDNEVEEEVKQYTNGTNVEEEPFVEDVVFNPGPYSNLNKPAGTKETPLSGYLKSKTVEEMWSPVPKTNPGWGDDMKYGLGWAVRPREKNYAFCKDQNFYVSHTGGAIGASSVLLIAPHSLNDEAKLPQGVVVAILSNLQGVGLNKLAADIARAFEGIETERPVKVQKVYQC